MDKLLEIARKSCDQVELYSFDETVNIIQFENSRLKDVDSKVQSGISLRVIKDNKLGFAYTKNLINRDELLQNALNALKGKVEAKFNFPLTRNFPKLKTYDSGIEKISNIDLVEECNRVSAILSSKTKGQVNTVAVSSINGLGIMNSTGTNLSLKTSEYSIFITVLYPNSYAAICRLLSFKRFEKTPDDSLQSIIDLYNQSEKEVRPKSGRMKVLFMPEIMHVLMWRLQSAASGIAIYQKQSPLLEKIDDKIFDDKLTIANNPLDDKIPGARPFDDEAFPCSYFPIIENGVLRNFYYDLNYAEKINTKPTGHGFRSARWASETIALKPTPSLEHLYIQPGESPFSELLKQIDKGIIIAGALGAHSGNIPNGDFSIGLSPGLYVENGEIVGRVKDAMVAGNIYDTMKDVVAIEDSTHQAGGGIFPSILFDNVSVVT